MTMSSYITKLSKELGLPKVDADRPLMLDVRAVDVGKAKSRDPRRCAFARACKRIYRARQAFFFRTVAWLQFDDRLERYFLPESMQKELVSFDRSGTIASGTYRLSPPVPSQTLEAIQTRSEKRPGRHEPRGGDIKRKFVHRTTDIRGLGL